MRIIRNKKDLPRAKVMPAPRPGEARDGRAAIATSCDVYTAGGTVSADRAQWNAKRSMEREYPFKIPDSIVKRMNCCKSGVAA